MAIVDDIQGDKRTKTVLDQTNTKTVGAPLAATGLVGDQLPDEVFTVGDFDTVKNQVNLEARNFQLLDSLNTMGQITNMQSQSGPIANTQVVKRIVDTTGSGNPTGNIFVPDHGTVWELNTLDWEGKNATSMNFWIEDENSNKSRIDYQSSTGSTIYSGVVKVGYPCKLVYNISGSTGDNTFSASLVRVR